VRPWSASWTGAAGSVLWRKPRTAWTVEFLATHVGLSRAAIAALRPEGRRAPAHLPARWRLALAADLLVARGYRREGRLRQRLRNQCGLQARPRCIPAEPPKPPRRLTPTGQAVRDRSPQAPPDTACGRRCCPEYASAQCGAGCSVGVRRDDPALAGLDDHEPLP